jgi:large subunit ribosomal protein L13
VRSVSLETAQSGVGHADVSFSRISSHENVFGKARRSDEEVDPDRRQRSGGRPTYTPHVDCGDHVIIVNAAHVVLTGRKRDNKVYYNHTGFIGGIKERTAKSILEGRFPERVVEKAIERMIPRGPLGRVQMGNLRVYPGPEHPHEAQQPETLDIAAMNRKNMRAA